MKHFAKLIDEAHERAALVLFLTALGLELFAGFGDGSTVAILFLSVLTLFGSERYDAFSVGNLASIGRYLPQHPDDPGTE